MKYKSALLATLLAFGISTASAQLNSDLQDKLDQKPNTTRVDVIILTGSGSNERASEAVRNANGNISHEFGIINGVAVTIPKVAAKNLANRDFVREIQPDYDVETRLDASTGTINVEKVWQENNTGEGVDVAVLDTGVEDNTILNVQDQVDYTGEGTDDLNGHGTHVAGVAASTDEQYRGVAYDADILDVKVLNQDGTGSASDVIEGLEWSVENGAEVATLSLGAQVSECDGTSAISEAVDNTVDRGVAVTVAAGNNGPESQTITAPGCAREPITVGSSNSGEISDFSSRGPTADGRVKPDIVAPGERITSLSNNNGSGTKFETLSGTSMATPHAAGTAALLLSENEELEPGEIKNITKTSAEDLGFNDNSQGDGLLDAYAAYQQISEQEANTTEQNESRSNQAPVIKSLGVESVEVNGSPGAEMVVNATDLDNDTLNVEFYFGGEQAFSSRGYGKLTYTESNLSANTTYNWRAEASDNINTSSTGKIEFTLASTNEGEGDERNGTRRNNSNLPPQASETARKATGGFFNPNSPFYGIDVFFDRASVAVGIKSKESVMGERAMEARVMSDRGNENAAQRAIKNLRRTAGDSENSTKEAEEALENALEGAPDQAKQGLRNALTNVEKDRKERISRREQRSNDSAGEEDRDDNSQREGPDIGRNSTSNDIGEAAAEDKTDRGPQRDSKQESRVNVSGEQNKTPAIRRGQNEGSSTRDRSNSTDERNNESMRLEPPKNPRDREKQDQEEGNSAEAELDAEAGAEVSPSGTEAEADVEAQGSASGDTGYNNANPDRKKQPETSYGY